MTVDRSPWIEWSRLSLLAENWASAAQLGATAVIGFRFDSNGIGQDSGLQEVLAYGTAIRTEPAS